MTMNSHTTKSNDVCRDPMDSPTDVKMITPVSLKPVRRVRFNYQVSCRRFTISSSVIKEDQWYSPREMREHKQRDRHLQTIMSTRENSMLGDDDTENLPLYGLRTVQENRSRKRLVRDARASVFGEQDSHDELFLLIVDATNDDLEDAVRLNQKLIAEAYSHCSSRAALIAYMRGVQAEKNVKALWSEEVVAEKNESCHSSRSLHSLSSRSGRSKILGLGVTPQRNNSNRSQPGYCITMRRAKD